MDYIIALAFGITASLAAGTALAIRDMGGWKPLRDAALRNNRRHQEREDAT